MADRRYAFSVGLLVSCLLLPLHSSSPGGTLEAGIDEIVRAEVKYDLFSGTVLVADHGEVIYSGSFGHADKDHDVPNKLTTRFNIGSIGKVFTATLIMQLVQSGDIALTDPLGKYLPDYPHPEKDRIQIGHLLNHSSGLGNYMEHEDYEPKKATLREISDVLPLIYEEEPLFEPGTDHRYSNSSMVVAGAVIEKVTGMDYREALEERILDPLGMTGSGIVYPEEVVPDRATGYRRMGNGSYRVEVFGEPPAFSDGGLYSTVLDLLAFDQALYGEDLLTDKYKQKMFTPEGPDRYAGYGWGVIPWGGTLVLMHSGGCPGFNADFRRYPEKGLTLIVLSNYYDGAFELTNTIEALLLGLDYSPASEFTGNYRDGLHMQRHEDHRKAVEYFERNIRGDNPHLPSLYQSARSRIVGKFDLEVAIRALDRYIEIADEKTEPSIAAAWWRKGNAYEELGDMEAAVRCYETSLDIDADFEEAKQALERIR
jgi:CubicO group peptidase (beta-lactamase class C family)